MTNGKSTKSELTEKLFIKLNNNMMKITVDWVLETLALLVHNETIK